jgi:DNA-binding IclR family transcriptional regulator
MLSILSALGRYPTGASVTEIANAVGLPPSSMHRALRAMMDHDLVWQDPMSRKYSLGMGLLKLGALVRQTTTEPALFQQAEPRLAELSENIHEEVFLAVLARDQVVIVEALASVPQPQMLIKMPCADLSPLHCGSSAKAILAFLPGPDLCRIVEHCTFRPFTMYTLSSREDLLNNLQDVRESGFGACDEEYSLGISAVAVPVLNRQGRPFASLGVKASASRLSGAFRSRVVDDLKSIARELQTV